MGYIEELRELVGTRPLILTGVTALVIDQHRRFLMVQSGKIWKIPGGFIELGETAEDACRREIFEETGINIGNLQLIGVFSGRDFFTKLPNGDEYYPITLAYVTEDIRSGDIKADEVEIQKAQFFKWSAFPKELTPRDRQIFQSFVENLILERRRG
ncbi:ADP-ribose pyrophosphatase YjhB (NUDIX family) [Neobacillus niacini]|uniref:NUDIX hydrolase n=1 Tax=Neobacillus niacini TaxID=86668 RepID=UPI0028562F14|nr:NUDIX domain-containing protein [Neobacillus niacini]MDR7080254.1 ADP-ribose pyrophosphatase YjhB (NUDIX family) [Neobacillus niacini]